MKVFALLALSMGALLATTSSEAHSHPRPSAGLEPPMAHTVSITIDSVAALASPFTGPTPRASFSAPRVSTSFRSTPTYRSFSLTPSRTYTFSRASSPSISTRPATTSAPRTYSYPLTRSASSTPVSRPAEVHHYHNSSGGGGGLSATELILLNQALNSSHQSQQYSEAGATRHTPTSDIGATEFADRNEGISGWGIFGIVLLCLGVAALFGFLLNRLAK